jgi:uncharacterized protein DUF955
MLRAAHRVGEVRPGAIGIRDFARRLGLDIHTDSQSLPNGVLGQLSANHDGATIHTRSGRFGQVNDARVTFTIAHEVAHVLYNMSIGRKPTNRSEYWSLESLCNRVAAILLVPDRLVEEILRSRGTSRELMNSIVQVSGKLGVSRDVALRRVAERLEADEVAGSIAVPRHEAKRYRVSWIQPEPWREVRAGQNVIATHRLWRILEAQPSDAGSIGLAHVDGLDVCSCRSATRLHFIGLDTGRAQARQ